jgi:hypothetical protein
VYTGQRGWDSVPCAELFTDELFDITGYASRFVELTRLAVLPEERGRHPRATLALFGNAVHAADANHCRYMVAAVRKEHIRFYRHLQFEPVADARKYPGLEFETALVVMDWEKSRSYLLAHRVFGAVFHFRREDPLLASSTVHTIKEYA